MFTLLRGKPPAFSSAILNVSVPRRKPLTDALGRDGDGLHLRSSCLTKQYSISLCRNASHLCFPNKPEEQCQWEAPNLTNSNSLFFVVVEKETTTTWDLLLVWLVYCFYPLKAFKGHLMFQMLTPGFIRRQQTPQHADRLSYFLIWIFIFSTCWMWLYSLIYCTVVNHWPWFDFCTNNALICYRKQHSIFLKFGKKVYKHRKMWSDDKCKLKHSPLPSLHTFYICWQYLNFFVVVVWFTLIPVELSWIFLMFFRQIS